MSGFLFKISSVASVLAYISAVRLDVSSQGLNPRGFQNPAIPRLYKPETLNPKPETRNPKPETLNLHQDVSGFEFQVVYPLCPL